VIRREVQQKPGFFTFDGKFIWQEETRFLFDRYCTPR
jgi:hypothetical protein